MKKIITLLVLCLLTIAGLAQNSGTVPAKRKAPPKATEVKKQQEAKEKDKKVREKQLKERQEVSEDKGEAKLEIPNTRYSYLQVTQPLGYFKNSLPQDGNVFDFYRGKHGMNMANLFTFGFGTTYKPLFQLPKKAGGIVCQIDYNWLTFSGTVALPDDRGTMYSIGTAVGLKLSKYFDKNHHIYFKMAAMGRAFVAGYHFADINENVTENSGVGSYLCPSYELGITLNRISLSMFYYKTTIKTGGSNGFSPVADVPVGFQVVGMSRAGELGAKVTFNFPK